jgi:hypothetical protein
MVINLGRIDETLEGRVAAADDVRSEISDRRSIVDFRDLRLCRVAKSLIYKVEPHGIGSASTVIHDP